MQMAEWGLPPSRILIDYESKFPRSFDAVFAAEGAKVQRVGPRAPNLNSVVERFIQSLKVECLDQFVVCGERHLRHLLKQYLEHYNTERPHQAKGNVPLAEADREESSVVRLPTVPTGEVRCRERLGGLLRHYHRDAA
jgi:hypothetical protein